jgi:hypothetical protein
METDNTALVQKARGTKAEKDMAEHGNVMFAAIARVGRHAA